MTTELFTELEREAQAFELELSVVDDSTPTSDIVAAIDSALDRALACMEIVGRLRVHEDPAGHEAKVCRARADRLARTWRGALLDIAVLRRHFEELGR